VVLGIGLFRITEFDKSLCHDDITSEDICSNGFASAITLPGVGLDAFIEAVDG
jgi:hypothetical protein